MEKILLDKINDVSVDEIPVVAMVVCDNKIVSFGFNDVEKTKNILGHAEINAIVAAVKKRKDWRLDDCELYCTLEPCNMCMEIIKRARIKKVYYYLKKTKEVSLKTKFIYKYNENIEKQMLIKMESLFSKIRNKDS